MERTVAVFSSLFPSESIPAKKIKLFDHARSKYYIGHLLCLTKVILFFLFF